MLSLKRALPLTLSAAISGLLACSDAARSLPQPTTMPPAGRGPGSSGSGAGNGSPAGAPATAGSSAGSSTNAAHGGGAGGFGSAGSVPGAEAGSPASAPSAGASGSGGEAAASSGSAGTAGLDTGASGSAGAGAVGTEADLPAGEGSSSADDRKLQAGIVMHQVPAGYEAHTCVVVELPNTEPVWASEIHVTVSEGSHHLIVDRLPVGSETAIEAQPCPPSMGGDQTRLTIAQQPETRVTLPQGVAYRIEAQQPIWLQLHFINLRDKPLDISGNVELVRARSEAGAPAEARSLFTGTASLMLPARQKTTVKSFHMPGAPAQGKRHVIALTSHTHSLGIRATIERVANADAPPTTPLHESLDWAEPPLSQLTPALEWDQNTMDGLRLTCEYDNNTDHDVHFGTAFHDEMCFMWLYYYDR